MHSHTVADDWELINPPPIDQVRGGTVGDSPRARPRDLWKSAIEQQILLNQMNKQNQSVESGSCVEGGGVYAHHISHLACSLVQKL